MKRLVISVGAALCVFACSGAAPTPTASAKSPSEMPLTSKSPDAIDHFKKGRDLADNSRFAEATQEFDQALKLDPDFALALAYRGSFTPGPDGLKDIEQASAKTAAISKPEQLMIAAIAAGRRGEFARSEDQWKQLTDLVPGDWHAYQGRGFQLFFVQKYGDALDALNKATTLNPNAGSAYNMIGYAHLLQGDAGPAVDALKKYASLAPNEPNPQDSLGEALMANGQFADAEAAFQKALSILPTFSIAWEGAAYSKFFANDWAGGQTAAAKARETAARKPDRISADRLAAFAAVASGKTNDGLARLDAIAKSPDASSIDIALVPVDRAIVLVENGRYRDALTEATKAIATANADPFPPEARVRIRSQALAITASAQARMGDAAGLEQTVVALQKEAEAKPDDPNVKSAVTLAEGALAISKKDTKTARMHFEMCSTQDNYCQWQAVELSRKAGDTEGANALLARLTKIYRRDPIYLYARSVVSPTKPTRPS